MSEAVDCNSIEEVRTNINRIDRLIVELLAERGWSAMAIHRRKLSI